MENYYVVSDGGGIEYARFLESDLGIAQDFCDKHNLDVNKQIIFIDVLKAQNVKINQYYRAKNTQNGNSWMVWAVDDNLSFVSLLSSKDGKGKRIRMDKLLKNWVKL